MPTSETFIPSYRRHRPSGQAVVTLSGQDVYLGTYRTRESRERYDRLIAEWIAAGRRLPSDPQQITIAEVTAAYRKHAQSYYRLPDGTPTSEASRIDREVGPLLKLYARTPAAEFGPLRLKAVREAMVTAGWVRTSVNHAIGTIKRVFKWATENELIAAHIHHALQAVAGLRAGRSDAPEAEPVRPVPTATVDATLPHLSRQVRAMVRLQLITGMRPGEVCAMRSCDIDTTGSLWVYRPAHHKTSHHGHTREVYLGQRAQDIIKPLLKPDLSAFIFSPIDAERERRAARHAARRTPPSCGNVPGSSRKRNRRRPLGDCYTNESYRRAITRACDRADEFAKGGMVIGDDERVVHRWHPHQLRHTAATELRKQYGLEAAQVILGHKTLTVTQVYAEKNIDAARRIMAAVG